MLYKLGKSDGIFDSLTPVEFQSISQEKDLENLLAKNLLDVLFEGNQLMPIFQERAFQAEADIYALNRAGDLVIFELKRNDAGCGAVNQALRYCETAAHWGYEKLEHMFLRYSKDEKLSDLREEHRVNFDLEHPLDKVAFNRCQRLIVVGSAGNGELVQNVDYWKSRGLLIDFIPYRVYALKNGEGDDFYFEFFSIPYDTHANPAQVKGVLFDTCRSFIEDSIWYMCENDRVAAFGDQKYIVNHLAPGDIVFLYHKWEGIVAAGKVKSGVKTDASWHDAMYRDLEWLTPKPTKGTSYNTMPAWEIKELLEHGFFWARTIKVPYLSREESEKLLEALTTKLTNSLLPEVETLGEGEAPADGETESSANPLP